VLYCKPFISKAIRYGPCVTTQFYLPATHEPYLPLPPSRKAYVTALWLWY